MYHIIVDCRSGVEHLQPLDAEEVSARAAMLGEHLQRVAQVDAREKYVLDVRARWDAYAALKGKSPEEIGTLMQARIDAWKSHADAQKDLREWVPLLAMAIAWLVVER